MGSRLEDSYESIECSLVHGQLLRSAAVKSAAGAGSRVPDTPTNECARSSPAPQPVLDEHDDGAAASIRAAYTNSLGTANANLEGELDSKADRSTADAKGEPVAIESLPVQ